MRPQNRKINSKGRPVQRTKKWQLRLVKQQAYRVGTVAEAMIRLLGDTTNEGLAQAKNILARDDFFWIKAFNCPILLMMGRKNLGTRWLRTRQCLDWPPSPCSFWRSRHQTPYFPVSMANSEQQTIMKWRSSRKPVDPECLEGHVVNFSRSLIRLAWILQHGNLIANGQWNPSRTQLPHCWCQRLSCMGTNATIKLTG